MYDGCMDDWKITPSPAGVYRGTHKSGATITARLRLAPGPERGGEFRVYRYELELADDLDVEPPIRRIEDEANERSAFASLAAALTPPLSSDDLGRMDLGDVARMSDDFFALLLEYVATCQAHGVRYDERIAQDNDVTPGTVRNWVSLAKKRGLR